MSRWRSVWLVARREVLERGRSRGFILSVAFTTLLVVGTFGLQVLFLGEGDTVKIGIAEPAPAGMEPALQAAAKPYDATVVVTDYADRTAGEIAVSGGEVAGFLVVPVDLSSPGEVVFDKRADQRVLAIANNAVVGLRQARLMDENDIPPADFVAAATPPEAIELDPQSEADQAAFFIANIGVILVFMGIVMFGNTVLTGVVEEKQSRVVEVVLSTIRARDLLMGKVLGIGLLGIVQLVIFVGVGLAAAIATDRFALPATTPGAVSMLALWFVLGYAMYATAFGFMGALASRTEEASNASMPVTMIAVLAYIASLIVVTEDPSGTVATVLTFLPPSAPMVVPLRAALDAMPLWQIPIAIVLTLATIYALFVVGGRVYSGAVLQTGARIKLRDAWRAAGE